MLEAGLSDLISASLQKETASQMLLSYTDQKYAVEMADLETVGYSTYGSKCSFPVLCCLSVQFICSV